MSGKKTKILFLCVGNTCRSQMAEGFARTLGKDFFEIKSAGTSAAGVVNKGSIAAMAEIGIDISRQTSDQLEDDMLDWADVVVTLGCCSAKEVCPVGFKGEMIDWDIDDPLGKPPEVMSRVRNDIGWRVKELLKKLKGDG